MVRSGSLNVFLELNRAFSGLAEMGRIEEIRSDATRYFMARTDPTRINPSKLPFKESLRHRRKVRDLARNVAALGLKRLMISSAKPCMKTNQLDLRAAFFIIFSLSIFVRGERSSLII
jgi:hypothetical protein